MKCKKCGSEWNSTIQMENCPFCGSSLKEEPTEFESIPDALQYLIEKNGFDVLNDYAVVSSYIADMVKGSEREKKLFTIGCSYGILEKINTVFLESEKNNQKELLKDIKHFLIDQFFMSEKNAVELINFFLIGAKLAPLTCSQKAETSASQHILLSIPDRSVITPMVAAGTDHTVALNHDGTVFCAGSARYGQCKTKEWKNVVAISAGKSRWNCTGYRK